MIYAIKFFKISPWDKFDIGSITKAAESNGIEKTRGGITKFTRRCSRSNCCKSVFVVTCSIQ